MDSFRNHILTPVVLASVDHRFGDCANRVNTGGECSGLKICVNSGTTYANRVADIFDEAFIVPRQGGDLVAEGLGTGDCNAIAGGVVDVSLTNVRANGYQGPYEAGSRRFSKDPLALVTRSDDPQWSDFVFWIVSALFYAEEEGITQSTSNQMPTTNLFGPLHTKIFRDAVAAVGSYGDIYARNAEQSVPRSGLNALNAQPHGPQHYALPGIL